MNDSITIYQFLSELLKTLQDHPKEIITVFFIIFFLCMILSIFIILIISIFHDLRNHIDENSVLRNPMKKKKLKQLQYQKKEQKSKRIKQKKGKNRLEEKWLIVADSIIGKGHIEATPPLPCQDSHKIEYLNNNWGIAVVADGLGSKPKSHIGSKFVSEKVIFHLKNLMNDKKWFQENKILSFKEWDKMALEVLFKTYSDTVRFAEKEKYEVSHLATTVIVVVFSPFGLLVTHMGDGRAGYCTLDGEWKAMITPINGEEATQVMPITAPIWQSMESVKPYIESRVIDEPIQAFTLMSDGCESFCYETQSWNIETNMCDNINLPHKGFFNPIIEKLKYFGQTKMSKEEINFIWKKFLESGNKKIKDEPDDKTLIVGVLIKGKHR